MSDYNHTFAYKIDTTAKQCCYESISTRKVILDLLCDLDC